MEDLKLQIADLTKSAQAVQEDCHTYCTNQEFPLSERWDFWLFEVPFHFKSHIEMDYLQLGCERYDWHDDIFVGNGYTETEIETGQLFEQLETFLDNDNWHTYNSMKNGSLSWDEADLDILKEQILALNAGTLYW